MRHTDLIDSLSTLVDSALALHVAPGATAPALLKVLNTMRSKIDEARPVAGRGHKPPPDVAAAMASLAHDHDQLESCCSRIIDDDPGILILASGYAKPRAKAALKGMEAHSDGVARILAAEALVFALAELKIYEFAERAFVAMTTGTEE